MAKKKDDEPCMSCTIAVASGEYLRVCKKVAGKKQCKSIMDDFINERITPSRLFRRVRQIVKKGSKEEKTLDEVDSFMVGEFKNAKKSKGKKKRKDK